MQWLAGWTISIIGIAIIHLEYTSPSTQLAVGFALLWSGGIVLALGDC